MSFQRIFGFGALVFLALRAAAQVTWTGVGTDSNVTTPANWSTAFSNNGTANLVFGVSAVTAPVVNAPLSVNSLTFQSGAPTFTIGNSGGGGLTVNSSIAQLSNAYQTISAPLTLGSSFTFSGTGGTTYLNVTGGITAPAGFSVTSGADVRVSGGWSVSGPITVGAGSVLEFVNSNVSVANNIANNGAIGFGNGTNSVVYDGVMSGGGSVTVNSGMTILSAANSYTGGTIVTGTLQVTNAGGSGTGTGTVVVSPGAILKIGDGGTTGAVSGTMVDNGVIRFNRSDAISYGGISGSGSIKQVGSGTLTLSGSNTYAGSTIVESGTVTDAAAGALPAGGNVQIGAGTLKVGFNESIRLGDWGSSGITGGVTIEPGAVLTLSSGSSYSGTISGGGSLLLSSGIFQTLTGTITHGGGTTISPNAMLHLGDGITSGSLTGNVTNNGGLIFSPGSTGGTYGGAITGTGNLFVGTATEYLSGAVTLTGANSYSGYTMINAGTLRIGAVNTLPTSTAVGFYSSGTLDVAANQTVGKVDSQDFGARILLETGATLTVAPAAGNYGGTFNGLVSGGGNLVFAGAANTGITLTNTNSYSGTTTISGGTVFVNSYALGTGQVTLLPGAQLAINKSPSTYDVYLPNRIVTSDQVTFRGGKDRLMILGGDVTVPNGPSTIHLSDWVRFEGALKSASGSSVLGFDSAPGSFGRAVITGAINPVGATGTIAGFNLNAAGVIFGAAGSVPTAPFTIKGSNAYLGIASVSGAAPTASSVLSLIDKPNFTGVLGFDTLAEDTAPTVFADAIDLTGFGSSISLGSATSAVLTGTITPDGDYRFGNGGGALVVTSQLTGNRGVIVNSTAAVSGNYLTLVLRNTGRDVNGNWVPLSANNFTGNLAVTNSVVVLDSASALPAGSTVTLGANGYIGYTEAFTGTGSFGQFITTRLVPGGYTPTSVLGLDSHGVVNDRVRYGFSNSNRWFTETIDLRALGSIYLGTTTSTSIYDVIWAPTQSGANKTLSLLAASDGTLTIESPLRGGNVDRVVIGSSAPYATGRVALHGANTYAGGTTLQSGTLLVGGEPSSLLTSGPLGTGVLTVPADAKKATLAADGYDPAFVSNPIALGTALQIGLPDLTPPAYAARAGMAGMENPDGNGYLFLNGIISDLNAATHGSLDIYTPTYLNAANTFSGGVTLHETFLALGNDTALGTGSLTFTSGTTYSYNDTVLATYTGPRTIANNLVFSGNRESAITFTGNASFTFTGSFTLNNDVTLAPEQRPVYFNGPITGNGRLMTDGAGTIVLGGSNSYSGGTEVQYGSLVFASPASMPAIPNFGAFTTGSSGYIGIRFVPANLQSSFIDRFNKSDSSGAIGFDSASAAAPNTFSGPIDLRGFHDEARIGSSSGAILTGTITPQDTTYNFGGGGGVLEVRSALTDISPTEPRSVNVDSGSGRPLTLQLTGTNTFSGGVTVTNSGVVFGPGALPASGTVTASYQSYVGTTDSSAATNPGSFINRIGTDASNAIVGFDGLNVTGNVSLANFNGTSDPEIFIGTASTATISGGITLPPGQSAYRFAGYKGGQLTVGTTLTGSNNVVIGDNNWSATAGTPGDPDSVRSTVKLTAANSYTGGTWLNAGVLIVASATGASALGDYSGQLAISSSTSDGRHVGLFAADRAQTLGNGVSLGSALDIGGAQDLTLTGAITGAGALYKQGAGLLTLSGTNTSSGGIYLEQGGITFTNPFSVGDGPVQFISTSGASVTFADQSIVKGLSGDNPLDVVNVVNGGTLRIQQPDDAEYRGSFAGSNISLVFQGPSPMRLGGSSSFTGAATIGTEAVVVAGTPTAFGVATNPVTLGGGQLAVGSGVVLANPLTLTAGQLAGSGTFKVPAASAGYTIGNNLALSPGFRSAADLKLDLSGTTLVLAGGGGFIWELSDAANAGGWDTVTISGNVNVTATATTPFTFKIGTIGADGSNSFAANFDPSQPYSWTVLNASSITGFTGGGQFVLETSGFLNPNTGFFTLTQAGSSLTLNFSPIPEPSTYALMLAGLAATLFAFRHRRR